MLYGNSHEGETLFGKFINDFCYNLPAGQAVRNRAQYIKKKLESVTEKATNIRNKYPVLITSIGSGPAKEIQDFLTNNEKSNICEFSLIDFDNIALFYSQEKLLEIKTTMKRKTKINFIQNSITGIVKEKENRLFKKQDIIYSIGLFDYLTTDIAHRLIRIFYGSLKKNGILIIGNFDPSNETKNFMEYVLEWYLIYRDPKEMCNLAKELPNSVNYLIEKDSTGINNFLILKKP